jgi:hypothetical protein
VATRNEQQYIDGNLQIVPGAGVESMRTYTMDEIESLVAGLAVDPQTALPASFVVGRQIAVTIAGPVGDTYTMGTGAAFTKREHAAVMEMRDRDGAAASARWGMLRWRHTDDGFNSVPTKILAGNVIQYGVRINDYPSGATTDTDGQHFLDRWAHGAGEHPTINSVTNLAPGLKLKITEANLWRAWSSVADDRPCTVWLNSPETSGSEAIYTGVLESDGVDVFVDVPHWFGQTGAPSLVVGDYTIHVHGLTFSLKSGFDLTAQATNGVDTYVVFGEYDQATASFDVTTQTIVPTLQMLQSFGLFGNNPIPGALRKALRAGCFLGDYETTRDFNAVANVTVSWAADPTTITFNNFADLTTIEGRYFFAGNEALGFAPHTHRVANWWQTAGGATVGHIATIARSEPTGNYLVVATTEPLSTNPAEYAVQMQIIADPGPLPDFEDREILAIWGFGFTTGTGVVAGIVPVDLSQRRGISDGSLWGDGNDGAANLYQPAITGELVGAESLAVLLRNNVALNYAVSKFLEAVTVNAAERNLYLWPASGAGHLATETVAVRLGGSNDYMIEASDVAGTKSLLIRGAASVWGTHRRVGGEGGASTGLLEFADFQLQAPGKTVARMVPLEGAWGDVDTYHDDGIDRALPRWDVCSVEDAPGLAGAGGVVVVTDQTIADAFSLTTDDVLIIKAAFRIVDIDGETLTLLQISMWDGGENIIWDHEDSAGLTLPNAYYGAHAETNGDLAYCELHVSVVATGANGQLRVTYPAESLDPAAAPNPSPFGQPGACRLDRLHPQASTAANFDTTVDTTIRVLSQWSAGLGAQDVRLERLDVTRSRRDLWRTNRDDGWYLETGNDRELRIPLPVNVDNNHRLTNAEVWCAVGVGGAATCRLELDLIEYDPVTGNETSLLAAVVTKENNSFVAPVVLTCNPANPVMASDKRYYIKIVTTQTTVGGQFQVRSAQINTQLFQIQ